MKDLKPNQKIYLSLLCIPIPSSSSIIDTHTQTKQILLRHQTHQHPPNMIPFLTRMYTQCRDLFAFRVCWVSLSLSPPCCWCLDIILSCLYCHMFFSEWWWKCGTDLFFEILPRLCYTSLDTVYTVRWVDICWIAKTTKTFSLVFGCFWIWAGNLKMSSPRNR
jgi:hypothetical protein